MTQPWSGRRKVVRAQNVGVRRLWLLLVGLVGACSETRGPPVETVRASLSIDVFEPGVRQVQEASGYQFEPAVARSGNVLLTAWSDGRFGTGALYRTLGTRLFVDGGRPDAVSVAISGSETQFGSGQSIGVLNGDFLIAWLDDGPYRTWFRRMRPDGTFLEPPRPLHLPGGSSGVPVVSAAPDHALIAWTSFDGPGGLGLAVVLLDGGLATPPGGVHLPGGRAGGRPTAGWLGNRHRLAWRESLLDGGSTLVVATVSFDGGLSFTNHGAIVSGELSDPVFTLDTGGAQYLATLRQPGPALQVFSAFAFSDTTWFSTVTTFAGTPTGMLASTPAASGALHFLGLDGDAGTSITTVLLSPTMSPTLLGAFAAESAASFAVAPLPSGELFGVFATAASLRTAAWTPPGIPGLVRQILPRSANSQRGASVLALDGGFLVSWSDSLDAQPGVYLAPVSETSTVGTPRSVRLGKLPLQDTTWLAPAPGGVWLLVQERAPVLLRLDPSGALIGAPRTLPTADTVLAPVSLSSGGVAWASSTGLAPGVVSWSVPSGQQGAVPLPDDALFLRSLASTGNRLLVSGRGSFLWVDLDGGLSDGGLFPQAFSDFSTVWSGPGHALHVQHTPTGLQLRRLREDGALLDPTPVALPLDAGNDGARRVAATWSGAGWDVLVNGRNAVDSQHVAVPLVGLPRLVRSLPGLATSVASDGQGRLLFTRDDVDDSPGVMANRVRLVLVSEGAQGSVCLANADCVSGFCVGGVCCNEACTGSCATCRAQDDGGVDGVCAPVLLQLGRVCRSRAGVCDSEERCDGRGRTCPADSFLPVGTPCAGGLCVEGGLCVPDGGLVDGGASGDAGQDAGAPVDAGVDGGRAPDAGTDAGLEADAGTDAGTDAGSGADAGPSREDAGGPPDAGGQPDAGNADAGSPNAEDGGASDAGLGFAVDGRSAAETRRLSVATGCRQVPAGSLSLLAMVFVSAIRRRKRT